MSPDAVTATFRFGLGPRPGELAQAAADPRGWLLAQLDGDPGPLPGEDALPASAAVVTAFVDARREAREGMAEARREFRMSALDVYREEVRARVAEGVRTAAPFRERLVLFWSNHFTVSARRPELLGLAGAFEREAIRPNVTGSFLDLLRAVVRHPGMLVYLDNARSVGPGSPAGQRRDRGLNENLARELMELHTLGVDGGYTQADVTQLARILTGWSVDEDGGFRFRELTHEPGPKVLLGRTYPEAGVDEGEAALAALARHPSTARHVATRLARHFAADDPPPALVDRLAARFLATDGDLPSVYRTLVEFARALGAAARQIPPALRVHARRLPRPRPHGPPRRPPARPPRHGPAALRRPLAARVGRPGGRLDLPRRPDAARRLGVLPRRGLPPRPARPPRDEPRPRRRRGDALRRPARRLGRRGDRPPARVARVPAEVR